LKNLRFVLLALPANLVVVPAIDWGIAEVLRLDGALATGLIIVSPGAGAPFLPKLVEMAKADIANGVALMVLLMVVTIGHAPVVIPILISGASVDAWAIAKPLLAMMLLPLAVGLLFRARRQEVADTVRGPAVRTSSCSPAIMMVLISFLNVDRC